MISSVPPSSTLLLPLSQLSPHCNRLTNSLHNDRISHKERILIEQTLWNEVKKIRALNDTSIYLYLVGFYHTILFQIAESRTKNDLFQYHVLIRLGDLNRYMEKPDVAEYYYCNARNLFPLFGHAYNQLGLLTKPTNCYKCCYYYARAAKSIEKPLSSIADSNLRIAVSKYNCEILNHLLNGDADIDPNTMLWTGRDTPTTAFEWFYCIVVAIYADNIQPIAKSFLLFLSEKFAALELATDQDETKASVIYCDRHSYILMASLDIMLDWLKLGSQSRATCSTVVSELRHIGTSLQSIMASIKNRNQHNAADSLDRLVALPHDYVLRGFSRLESVHEKLKFMAFDTITDVSRTVGLLNQIISRLLSKLHDLSPFIRKQTRNIALESILANTCASVSCASTLHRVKEGESD